MGSHFFTTDEINTWQADMLAQQTTWTIADLRYLSKSLHFHFYLSDNGRMAQYIDRLIRQMERRGLTSLSVVDKWEAYRIQCSALLKTEVPRRNGNRLNIEVGKPADRCLDKLPKDWPDKREGAGLIWVGSGGDVLIFGHCNHDCPRLKDEEAA